MIEYNLSVSKDFYKTMNRLCSIKDISVGELFRRSLALYGLATEEILKGNKIGIFNSSNKVITILTGEVLE